MINKTLSSPAKLSYLINHDGNTVTEDAMIAQELKNYFSSVYISDDGVIPLFPPIAVASEITSIHFDVFSVMKVLKSLRATYSVGPDGVPNVYLKNTCIDIVYPFALLFERSMIENYVPLI